MKLSRVLFLSFLLVQSMMLLSQSPTSEQTILNSIENLESTKDAKCHATASRLEDFMYGTPLSPDGRNDRIMFQKNFVKLLWTEFTRQKNSSTLNDIELFRSIEQRLIRYQQNEFGISVDFYSGDQLQITARDYTQYSSVAYALRAILSVQQAMLFETTSLTPLSDEVLEQLKQAVDIAVLSILQLSDKYARQEGAHTIDGVHFRLAVQKLFPDLFSLLPKLVGEAEGGVRMNLLHEIIGQKLRSYAAYNNINQSVFLRNIQVYFAKVPWPKEDSLSSELTSLFTETMVYFTADMLNYADKLASSQGFSSIGYPQMHKTIQAFLPHDVNQFEDVIFFPNLNKNESITIESYDLDAFRDSGLHWQYLKYVIDEKDFTLNSMPDPFALELLVEGVAQFGVLLFRMAGQEAISERQNHISTNNFSDALKLFQNKLNLNVSTTTKVKAPQLTSSNIEKNTQKHKETLLFDEVHKQMGIDFTHRNSDWLSRKIRSYVYKKDENVARLAIPPAFGGSGVAAEDINNDGWVDILLLGGAGNKLFINDKGERFIDITTKSGIDWKRKDHSYGEPRQPIIVDFDNDGFQDIFISYVNDLHRIYRNNGDETFEDVTQKANLGGLGKVGGPCTVLDYDNDGLLDLYIGYFGNYLTGELPTLDRYNINGDANKLFRNTGDFRFEDVSVGSGIQNKGWTQAVGHADINNDLLEDIIVGNDFGVNSYYINLGNGKFQDRSKDYGTDKPSYTMNIGISDLNGDEVHDYYISNIVVMEKDDKYVLPNKDTPMHFDPKSLSTMRVVEANDLFLSGYSSNDSLMFEESENVGRGFSSTGWSWDADFFDFDNDMDDDLYCLTGMNQYSVYGTENPYYSSPDGSNVEAVFAQSKEEKNILFENKGGRLEVVETLSGLDFKGTSRSAAYLDFDNDGDLDVIVNDYKGRAKLFRNNTVSGMNWVKIKLNGNPDENINRDAIGSKVIVKTKRGKIYKEVFSTTGYLSVHPKEMNIGLADAEEFDLEVIWSNGSRMKKSLLKSNRKYAFSMED